MLTAEDAATFERCMSVGGIAVFPADTVYGLACDAGDENAIRELYRRKRRPLDKPSAVLFFDRELAAAALPELGPRTRAAFEALLPGGVTLLVPNPAHRFRLACGDDPGTLGLRVPALPPSNAALHAVRWPVLQSSANLAGGPEARRLADVPAELRAAADLVLDGGELPGTASTVIDLRRYEDAGTWSIVRHGLVPEERVADALG
ncbi:MAG TPA: L-threonylcarbamoyladenylate synthase [Capillimicrobium sp.]|nr:L-threonylcarbamoyladenylate synthase [Capillimicrobium sp.]